ncbi:hypothetical protein B0T22DRAFT_532338 [Podospora appendiculata]|uniref:PNPLA domain-containing protein n=1 Tax=Podospora appendiculata TaxID=314037 RepID=A0AAE1CFU4_9PEZI|nr:hypothetical protein B0T22DRAFT_532338 [Podospora appendiculata]
MVVVRSSGQTIDIQGFGSMPFGTLMRGTHASALYDRGASRSGTQGLVRTQKPQTTVAIYAAIQILYRKCFSGLRFAKIKKDELISPQGHSRLQRHLHKASDRMRHNRADRGLLFSASHHMAFSEIAFDHLPLTEPFDFIKASRLLNPVAADLAQHLTNFVNQVQSAQDLTTSAAETIASSFLLDHYPPGMHVFKSSDVFHALYRDTCAYVARLTAQIDHPDGHLLPSAFVTLILKNMNSLSKEFFVGKSAAEIHLGNLQKYASKWAGLRSENTCFVCLRRVPHLGTECRHRICEICIKGVCRITDCGVRGIIPTTMLELLEERIGLPIPIQEHFKLALGINAGKMVVALFNDAIYRARYLERVLRETYGSDTKMLDPSYATTIGAKICLPVATVSEPTTLLFTNYNGAGEEALRLGYDVHKGSADVNVWEVARSCTVAPAYFKSKYIEGVGPLQDAGVLQNNPLTIALSELHAVYPAVSAPQFLINLGTGTVRSPDGPQENKPLSIFGNSFIVRLFRSYMSLLGGHIMFEGPEPKLDDVKVIPELKDMQKFIINGVKVPGNISDSSFWGVDGNFQKRIAFKASGEILISLVTVQSHSPQIRY